MVFAQTLDPDMDPQTTMDRHFQRLPFLQVQKKLLLAHNFKGPFLPLILSLPVHLLHSKFKYLIIISCLFLKLAVNNKTIEMFEMC